MTREEAIEELLHMKHIFIAESDAYKALDMAIEALKEQRQMFYISNTVDQKKIKDMIENYPPMFVEPGTEKIEIIRELHWIPCSERLPETDRQVIVQTEHGLITDGRWTGDTWFTTDDYTCYGVVAWMPLPEPYVPQESEDKE